jgi:hypothetical protein
MHVNKVKSKFSIVRDAKRKKRANKMQKGDSPALKNREERIFAVVRKRSSFFINSRVIIFFVCRAMLSPPFFCFIVS